MHNFTTVNHMIGGTWKKYLWSIATGFWEINYIPIIFTFFERDWISKSTIGEKSAAGLMRLKLQSCAIEFCKRLFLQTQKIQFTRDLSEWIYQKLTIKTLFLAQMKKHLCNHRFSCYQSLASCRSGESFEPCKVWGVGSQCPTGSSGWPYSTIPLDFKTQDIMLPFIPASAVFPGQA